MKKELKNSLPYWICCACINTCNFKFFKARKDNFDDVFLYAYVGILEGLNENSYLKKIDFDNRNLEKEIYSKLLLFAHRGVRKYGKNYLIRNKNNEEICCLDSPLKDEENSKNFGESLLFVDEPNFDYEIIVDLLKKELLNYSLKEREIILAYINGMTKQDVMKKFRISFEDLGRLIFLFRGRFKNILLKNDIVEFSFDSQNIEFSSYSLYQNTERRKELKNSLVFGRDIRILQLVKDLSINELSSLLGLSIDSLKDIIEHRKGSAKFWLYQVQKIRKKFFPKYSLEELLEVM